MTIINTKNDYKYSLIWNSEKKIYEVFPKINEDELYWNSRKQVKIEYK